MTKLSPQTYIREPFEHSRPWESESETILAPNCIIRISFAQILDAPHWLLYLFRATDSEQLLQHDSIRTYIFMCLGKALRIRIIPKCNYSDEILTFPRDNEEISFAGLSSHYTDKHHSTLPQCNDADSIQLFLNDIDRQTISSTGRRDRDSCGSTLLATTMVLLACYACRRWMLVTAFGETIAFLFSSNQFVRDKKTPVISSSHSSTIHSSCDAMGRPHRVRSITR